jgi:hypothetical protein
MPVIVFAAKQPPFAIKHDSIRCQVFVQEEHSLRLHSNGAVLLEHLSKACHDQAFCQVNSC